MSDKKGPFDAAIMNLQIALAEAEAEADLDKDDGLMGTNHYKTQVMLINEYRTAIHVLEAAGKMLPEDRTWLQHQVDRIQEYAPMPDAGYICPGRSRKDRFRVLLESLPEKEE